MHNINTVILTFTAFAAVGAVSMWLYFWLREKSQRTKLWPFLIATVSMLLFEGVKQIYGIVQGEYDLFWLPLHICTVSIIAFVLVSLFNQEWAITKILWYLSLTAGLVVSLAMIIAPWPIIGYSVDDIFAGKADYLDFYSVFVHYLFVLLFVLGVLLQPYKPRLKDLMWSSLIWTGSLIVIVIVATLTQVNYAMFLDFKLPWLVDLQESHFAIFQCLLFVCYILAYLGSGFILFGLSKVIFKGQSGSQEFDIERLHMEYYKEIAKNMI